MMEKIISREPVFISNGRGGFNKVFIEVPAEKDSETGEIYLGDEALRILDDYKAKAEKEQSERMSVWAAEQIIRELQANPTLRSQIASMIASKKDKDLV